MYPSSMFNWHDQSEINNNIANEIVSNAPLFMQVFSCDKGPEELTLVQGEEFDALFGTMSFTRHGQSSIQARNIIANGGKLLAKRIVADDSTLANIIFVATVTTEDGKAKIKWSTQSFAGCKTFEEVNKKALELFNAESGTFPLFVFTDNGRGVSAKSVRINPDYTVSKTIGKTFYTLAIYEGAKSIENESISFDPAVIYSNQSYHLNSTTCTQVKGLVIENVYEEFVSKLADATKIDEDTLRNYDILFGYTNNGSVIDQIVVDKEGVDLDSEVGILLAEGSNGNFGNAPVGTAAWEKALVDFFTGKYTDRIYDVDTYKVCAICDANYPTAVKNAIADLVDFREDMFFFRDFGTGLTTFLEIKAKYEEFKEHRSRFIADYCTSFEIRDPNTFKNIEVTMTYDLAGCLVNHFATNAYAPIAGITNGFVLPNVIEGTVSFHPINTPTVNQKEAMEDIKVNYAIFDGNQCVVQTCYTSQDKYTDLSYISNVICIQNVVRAVRTACPKQRYSLATGNDLSAYAAAVSTVLSKYASNFAILNFQYTRDDLKSKQKIFYAGIQFAFNSWAQTEIFDLYAINADE